MCGHGTGSEVMRRIAAPMVGGMITTTVLTLIVIPALYFIWAARSPLRKQRGKVEIKKKPNLKLLKQGD